MATPLPKLSVSEWHDVKDLAATISSYDQAESPIKGKTSIQVLGEIKILLDTASYLQADDLIDWMIKREAYNQFVGIEGKRRRTAKR